MNNNRSTETAISNTVNYIEKSHRKNEHCLAVFLDIAATFDTIKPDHIRKTLLEKEVDGNLVRWYYNYITERHLTLESNDYEIKTKVDVGFPQGRVCSAKLWIIAFDPAIQIINEDDIFGQGFVDDCAALIGGENLNDMTTRMNATLKKLVRWGTTCGLSFNPSKTVLLHFKNSCKRRQYNPEKHMNGQTITPSKHTRYLGVEIDNELTWKHNISTKIEKCRNLMAIISANVRHTFGPTPKLVKWAYTGVIRPKSICLPSVGKQSHSKANKMHEKTGSTNNHGDGPNQEDCPASQS